MDLFGPIDVPSLRGSKYAFVVVDDYTWYTWVMFLVHKNEAFDEFAKLCRKVQNEKGYFIKNIRSDNETEYVNTSFMSYCDVHGIEHNFLAPRTPQQNEVVEKKNRTLQEMARTMLKEHSLPTYFWCEAINTHVMYKNEF